MSVIVALSGLVIRPFVIGVLERVYAFFLLDPVWNCIPLVNDTYIVEISSLALSPFITSFCSFLRHCCVAPGRPSVVVVVVNRGSLPGLDKH